ncbi:hypothetical protein HPE56_14145 [Maribacter sp. ANRC-HE7]|uniref:Uncharacterized protein n=1 Tax=Maribacter aquimaris TaxID=2737171 RepID=A0ABR7V6T0_9FLAO|nr:hypothetical protein [Maribacter aquimaris]MBD0778937.1 hypothetical protein [Maribacter aquimaris]
MIKFFRKIRQQLLIENKFGKYLTYAIGEIVLVIIGILMALQINNWNSDRIDRATVANYYKRIHSEIQEGIKTVESFTEKAKYIGSLNKRTLKVLASKNYDSIPVLKETLGALGTSWTLDVNFPVTEEFLNQGYLSKVQNDSVKLAFNYYVYSMKEIDIMEKFTSSQYNDRIEPYIIKNLNYSEIALPLYRKGLIPGGTPTNFELLFNDLELWNNVTLKMEGITLDIKSYKKIIESLNKLDEQILRQLQQG